jgi:formylglycine-generating enzyme required for sulfatase activity
MPSSAPLTVELILKAGKGPERTLRMDPRGDRYRVTAVPIPEPSGPWTLRLAARFDNATLEATTTERSLTIGGREAKLSDVRSVFPGSPSRVVLRSGQTISGVLDGLEAVSIRLSGQTMSVDLASAMEVTVTPAGEDERVACRLVVRQGQKEIYRQSESLGTADLRSIAVNGDVTIKLIRIEPGEFLMGSHDPDPFARANEKPQHLVRISKAFYLGAHEVTQGQYRAVMGENPSRFNTSDDLPVERVSWRNAIMFCNKLSERDGRKPYYRIDRDKGMVAGGNGYRLPSEAEWEYACRAGTTTVYPFGDDAGALGEYAWHGPNSQSKTHPVGQKRTNRWGLHDMLGNVWEWCADRLGEHYYASSPAADPPGDSLASTELLRGGSWDNHPKDCRPAFRQGSSPGGQGENIGFRVATDQE